jgi:hypothetical protein
MTLQLTQDDLLLLEKQRLERFRACFTESLSLCFLHLNQNHELNIHCSEPWLVDWLLFNIEAVCWQAWLIVGAYQVSIYYAREEIYTVETHSLMPSVHKAHDCSIAS